MQSPFERLLSDVAAQAQKEPLVAFGRLQECYNKSLTDLDVRNLSAFAANLGGTGLGRFDDAITFIETLFDHPALEQDGDTARSLWRAIACLQRCAGRADKAKEALEKGTTNDSERLRVEILCAQMLTARGRAGEAIPMLKRSRVLLDSVEDSDDIMPQVVQVSAAVSRLAEQQLVVARELLQSAADAGHAAMSRSKMWRNQHKGMYQRANAHILAGEPREALSLVGNMMALEDSNGEAVTNVERFFTASLACRAQILRGQMRVAAGALEACSDFAKRVDDEQERKVVEATLNQLQEVLNRYI